MRTLRTSMVVGLWAAVVGSACVGEGRDNATSVHDLRVLGARFDPPDVMMNACTPVVFGALLGATRPDAGLTLDPRITALLSTSTSQPLTYTALIADPAGNGRELRYELATCASVGDKQCSKDGTRILLSEGTTTAGELKLNVMVGAQLMSNGDPLLLEAITRDTYKGLGGIRVPVVLKVTAPDTGEVVYAQKLMVYWCHFFPPMKQNVQPVLPSVTLNDEPWDAGEVKALSGQGPFKLNTGDYSDYEESYVVPTLEFKPVSLEESWIVAHYTTLGTMGSYETGGGLTTQVTKALDSEWNPDPKASEQDVTFWMVVRDGRGGLSWVSRTAHWTPKP